MQAIYIHIPFCRRICAYCDFPREYANPDKQSAYIDALFIELDAHAERIRDAGYLYIGGGTPSALPLRLLRRLFEKIETLMPALEEVSIECNPEDVDERLARLLSESGVTRVSFGVQTFQAQTLDLLGRSHTPEMVKEGVDRLRHAGIFNLNIDMMYALPEQSMQSLEADIDQALEIGVPHISYYGLEVEKETRFRRLLDLGRLKLPSEEAEATMYQRVIERLTLAGYNHYEISAFAKPHYACKYNRHVWKNGEYLGLGAAAHSAYEGERRHNTARPRHYVDRLLNGGSPCEGKAPVTPDEAIFLGLRLREGLDIHAFETQFNVELGDRFPILDSFLEKGLLKIDSGRMQFTEKGRFLGNQVFMAVLGE